MRYPIPQEKWTDSGFRWLTWTGEAYHPGVDINTASGNNDRGEPIFCCDVGVVHKIDTAQGGFGKQIIVKHLNYYSRYAHLDTILVSEGQEVTPFIQIATMGNTGAASSAHLHFELPTEKLINYLKSVRPLDWFRFYPDGYSKKWVTEHYLNPNEHCTKQIKLLHVFYDTPVPTGYTYCSELQKWVYNASKTQISLDISSISLKPRINPIPWVTTQFMGGVVGNMIEQSWLRYWILAHASSYDIVVLHLKESLWKGGDVIAYAPVPKQLGIQPIISRCTEGTEPRYSDFCGGNIFIGQLRHELMHTLFSACGQHAQDNVHEMEAQKTLEECFKTLKFQKFVGWKPIIGTRMFIYGGVPTTKTSLFSGIPVNGKVYRTSDYRLFFYYENGWKQITESEFESAIKSNHNWGEMSVEEGNGIISSINGSFPEYIGNNIHEQIAENEERKLILKQAGWMTMIPSQHL